MTHRSCSGGASASKAYGKDWYTTRSRFNLTEDTRTATEYGVLRTYANVQMDWTRGNSGIAGGAPVEVDYAFIQFAGFTIGKAVSEFDPQWALAKPTITSGMWAGSNDATGINQLAYTATFGNGVSGTISLERRPALSHRGSREHGGCRAQPVHREFPAHRCLRPPQLHGQRGGLAITFRTSSAIFVSTRPGVRCTSLPRLTRCTATTMAPTARRVIRVRPMATRSAARSS